jgi:hypothetical protein
MSISCLTGSLFLLYSYHFLLYPKGLSEKCVKSTFLPSLTPIDFAKPSKLLMVLGNVSPKWMLEPDLKNLGLVSGPTIVNPNFSVNSRSKN